MCMVKSMNAHETPGSILRAVLESILGRSGYMALMHHLLKILGEDPLQLFFDKPRRFYEALKKIFGENGATVTFKIICGRLLELSGVLHPTADELFELMLVDEDSASQEIKRILEEALRR